MNPTDDIIAQRRKGAADGERREFSVDRAQAIAKMRQFALADPSFYLLELIQAAVANGGGYLNIDLFRLRRDSDDLKMWWSGRGFSEFELERLFDFLLMSEDEPGCADTILLARGVNAMLHFKPTKIVIASGDGTLDGSAQVVISRDGDIVVQEPPEPIGGVKIHGDGLYNSLLAPEPEQQLGDREVQLLREKVIAPGVQVMLNGHFISDWSSAYIEQRVWQSAYIAIEEDDLYGRLWEAPHGGRGEFDLMTYGVKVERVAREDAPFGGLHGAVNFDRLNKTADHAKIVRDEVLEELWARLRPYAEALHADHDQITYDIRPLDGTPLSPPELVELIQTHERAVVVPPRMLRDNRAKAARRIGEALEAPVMLVSWGERSTLRALAGTSMELVEPRLDEQRDVDVFTGPVAGPPPRPWLVEPVSVEPIPVPEFIEHMCDVHHLDDVDQHDEQARARLARTLGSMGEVFMRVYTPAGDTEAGVLNKRWVKLLVCEREVFSARFPSPFAGHELFIELPPASPTLLDRKVATDAGQVSIAELVARTCVELARHRLEEANARALAALSRVELEPGSASSRMALHTLSRTAMLRVRGGAIEVSTFDEKRAPLLDMPLFETLAGEPAGRAVSARDLAGLLRRGGGLLFGVRPSTTELPAGLEPEDVLVLDAEQEQLLVATLGADCYVRVDLAEEARSAPNAGWVEQERRRQQRRATWRQCLQHSLCGRTDGFEPAQRLVIDTADGGRCSFADVVARFERGESVVMFDGRAVDAVPPAGEGVERGDAAELRMNPFLFYLLAEHLPLEGAFDYDLSHAEAEQNPRTPKVAYIDEEVIEDRRVNGVVGLPVDEVAEPAIAIVEADTGRVHRLREPSRELRLVGRLVVREAQLVESPGFLEELIVEHGESLLDRLARRLPRLERSEERERVTRALLEFAGQKIQLRASPDGRFEWEVAHPLALRILDIPLFPGRRGAPVSGLRVIRHLCAQANSSGTTPDVDELLADQTPALLRRWIARYVDFERVFRAAPTKVVNEDAGLEFAGGEQLLEVLEYWLEELRPDRGEGEDMPRYELAWADVDYGWAEPPEPGWVHKLYRPHHGLLNREAPLAARAVEQPSAETIAWLLFVIYAGINKVLEPVTNAHELEFQRRVADALESGRLGVTSDGHVSTD